MRDFASIDTQISATGPRVCELWLLEFDRRLDFDFKLASDGSVWRERGVAATTHNKPYSLLYPMTSNNPGSNDKTMENFAKQIGTDFVTLEFSNMRGTRYRF